MENVEEEENCVSVVIWELDLAGPVFGGRWWEVDVWRFEEAFEGRGGESQGEGGDADADAGGKVS